MISFADRKSWLEARQRGVGSSDAPAVVGASDFKSEFELWSEKVGLIEPDDLSDVECVEWGNRLEPVVIDAFREKSGRAVERWTRFSVVQHPEHTFMLATPDAVQVCPDRGRGLVEIKTANAFLAKEWKDEPPLAYQVQAQHQLAVTGEKWGTLVCLIGGQRLCWFDFERNDRFIDSLVEREREFWRRVTEKDPPDPDGSEATRRALAKLYPTTNGATIRLPDDSAEWDEELVAIKRQIKDLEAQEKALENKLKAAIGEAEFGLLPNGLAYSYKSQTRGEYVVPECSFRVLRRSKK